MAAPVGLSTSKQPCAHWQMGRGVMEPLKCHGCGAIANLQLSRLSEPIPANKYWPSTAILIWVAPCCGKQAHTEAAASFGERESDRSINFANAASASQEFNSLPEKERNSDGARKIVIKHGGNFIFDRWLRKPRRPKPLRQWGR